MHFTPAVVVAILAHAATAACMPAAPSASPTTSPIAATAAATPSASSSLSLTQQLFLADTAAERFSLLPNDNQFIFDFNQAQKNPGKGGQVVAANRKTFPALVGTGAGMALGRVNRRPFSLFSLPCAVLRHRR
jgi:hypothetical protein